MRHVKGDSRRVKVIVRNVLVVVGRYPGEAMSRTKQESCIASHAADPALSLLHFGVYTPTALPRTPLAYGLGAGDPSDKVQGP